MHGCPVCGSPCLCGLVRCGHPSMSPPEGCLEVAAAPPAPRQQDLELELPDREPYTEDRKREQGDL